MGITFFVLTGDGQVIHESDLNNEDYQATYCPEDDKLRLYCGRVERETYDHLRANGFQATPKQDCDFVAVWTVAREDIALAMIHEADDIGDEDYSPQERAADRVERFEGYRERRASEAVGFADRYDDGDAAYGNQNRGCAERQAARRDRLVGKALTQWDKAEYWHARTARVREHAIYKSNACVRRTRINKLEAELRGFKKEAEKSEKIRKAWQSVLNGPDADTLVPLLENGYIDQKEATGFQVLAWNLSNSGGWNHYWHPTCEEANEWAKSLWGYGFSPYDLLTRTKFGEHEFDRLTIGAVAELVCESMGWLDDEDSHTRRRMAHLELRLAYENQMLGEQGGRMGDLGVIPGGWVHIGSRRLVRYTHEGGWAQIHKVNKSNETGRVTSVMIPGTGLFLNDHEVKLRRLDVTRHSAEDYRSPTPEELEAFNAAQTKLKQAAKAKAKKNPAPKLINPTLEDAQKLQAMFNAKAQHPSEVWQMTQAEYSERSKGEYGSCETIEISERGEQRRAHWNGTRGGRFTVFKVRKWYSRGAKLYSADRVVVLTDKPQKPLPFAEMERIRAEQPKAEDFVDQMERLYSLVYHGGSLSDGDEKFFGDAKYAGLTLSDSSTQRSFTDLGRKMWVEAKAKETGEQVGYVDSQGNRVTVDPGSLVEA